MPDPIKPFPDLPYTELIWIELPTSSFLYQNRIDVSFANGCYAGKYLVTQQLYEKVLNKNPSNFKGKYRPVEQDNWEDVLVFLEKLNELTTNQYNDDKEFRLPSTMVWEYCARNHVWEIEGIASTEHSAFGNFSGSHILDEVGWYEKNSYHQTQPVGLKEPNLLGLYDMSGNVWEWCDEKHRESWEEENINNKDRMIRGGCWNFYETGSQVLTSCFAASGDQKFGTGFRLFRY